MSDEFGESTATSAELAVGVQLRSAIDAAGDQDWFSLVLEGGKTYQFQLLGDSTTMMLADSGGGILQERRMGPLPDPITFTPLTTLPEYVAESLALQDRGMGFDAFMQRNLETFLGPNASSEAVVNLLYKNVRGMDPPTAALDYYTSIIDGGVMTPGELGAFAANHSFTTIKIVGLEKAGLMYSV